jgi:D-alanyl-D-alanine carboxypeptidase
MFELKRIKSIEPEQAVNHFDKYFAKIAQKHPSGIQIHIYSDPLQLNYTFPSNADQHRPFHIASVGKMFTATLVEMLAERGALSLDNPITTYFSESELRNLFLYKDNDYAHKVTIKQLLGHTSGIADYFEGPVTSGPPFLDEVLLKSDEHWTPEKLVHFTRENQKAVGVPGTLFHYSDTGYVLLGQIIEKVTAKSFSQNLHDEFFIPLEMNDSYLMFYSEPQNNSKKSIQPIWFNGIDISQFQSLSCDWSGGGIISTTHDLLLFYRALRNGKLISPETLKKMEDCPHKFRSGIYYGLGMMEIHFEGFFFLLKGLPRLKGHIGILSTHMFYDPSHDTYIIMNFGSNKDMVKSFKALIEIENTLKKFNKWF